jgi:hypothetical protein
MTERVLEAWVGKYVSVTLHTPRATGEHLTGEHLTGRIQAVGNDGFIIQPTATRAGAAISTRRCSSPGMRYTPSSSEATKNKAPAHSGARGCIGSSSDHNGA